MKLFSLLLFLVFSSAPANAIVDGATVSKEDFYAKRTVVIFVMDIKHRCTGAILAPKLIITAAHCIITPQAESYRVGFTTDMTPILQGKEAFLSREVKEIKIAPSFAEHDRYSDDIALLLLSEPIPAGYEVAELATKAPPTPALITALGFGLKNAEAIPFLPSEPISLGKKDLPSSVAPLIPNFPIDLGFHRLFFVQRQGGICEGDSGGPMYFEQKLVALNGAVMSGDGPTCANTAYGTLLAPSIEWLQKEMAAAK